MLQQLAPKYIDTGKAKVVYHQVAFIGQESEWAAEAADCAQDQNKFLDYAHYLLTHQAGENAGAFGKENLKKFATILQLDTAAFNPCLDGDKYQAAVRQETQEGTQRGVSATPTFFVNQQRIEGLLPVDQLSAVIDSMAR